MVEPDLRSAAALWVQQGSTVPATDAEVHLEQRFPSCAGGA